MTEAVVRPGGLSLEILGQEVALGAIDTVIVAFPDMQGRLVGKRFHAQHFLESAHKETHACNYLLTVDIDMEPVPGYRAASWQQGYGDYRLIPDLTTLRTIPWLEKTALVLCDLADHHGDDLIPHAPRTLLKRQTARLAALGLKAYMASELEFFLFDETYESAQLKDYRQLKTSGYYVEDYHILQTSKEEGIMRAIRNGLYGAGIAVECSKGEWGPGQEEINVRYAEALTMADNHVIMKNGIKEIAWAQGKALTFMAKWHYERAGNSAHIHQSLWSVDGREAKFHDPKGQYGMSGLMQHYLAGLLAHAQELTYFLAPYINSYKRFQVGTFAPTRAVWSLDNRTAGFRLCGQDSRAIRVECRIGGADLNPYLAFAALLAAGIDGIERQLTLEPAFSGDAYEGEERQVAKTLRAARQALDTSKMLRHAFGDAVIEHYLHTADWEQFEYDRRVTDWELRRGFEQY
jgi:glutamine synthetase